jgi:hypothetical protein
MKPKTIKTLYWIFTVLFLLAMLGDAYGGITMQQAGKDSLAKLGYPMYLLVIMGSAKIAGVVAIAQTKYRIIKEWAYSGFTISFIGAFLSWFCNRGRRCHAYSAVSNAAYYVFHLLLMEKI